jgi:hypothetical protein
MTLKGAANDDCSGPAQTEDAYQMAGSPCVARRTAL